MGELSGEHEAQEGLEEGDKGKAGVAEGNTVADDLFQDVRKIHSACNKMFLDTGSGKKMRLER